MHTHINVQIYNCAEWGQPPDLDEHRSRRHGVLACRPSNHIEKQGRLHNLLNAPGGRSKHDFVRMRGVRSRGTRENTQGQCAQQPHAPVSTSRRARLARELPNLSRRSSLLSLPISAHSNRTPAALRNDPQRSHLNTQILQQPACNLGQHAFRNKREEKNEWCRQSSAGRTHQSNNIRNSPFLLTMD